MTDKEYTKLESLLNKLSNYLDTNNVCIINNYLQDGFYISCFDKSGNIKKEKASSTIKNCIKYLKN